MKDFMEIKVQNIGVNKQRQNRVIHVKHGQAKIQTSTLIDQKRKKHTVLLVKETISAEIQVNLKPFGAILLMIKRDGKLVNHYLLLKKLL